MPKKIQNFAKSALVKPITINVGRAGAASLDVIQVHYLSLNFSFFFFSFDKIALNLKNMFMPKFHGLNLNACAGSGIRQRGGQDGVPPGVSPENTTSGRCRQIFNARSSKICEIKHVSSPSLLCQVLIFAEKKADVDAIHEYLLLKGVEAVAIHGGKGMLDSVLITEMQSSRHTVTFTCRGSLYLE